MRKIIITMLLQVLICCLVQAQGNKVTGVITDSAGNAILGASVVEKGVSTNGTAADAAGNFTLVLRGVTNRILVSSAGYIAREVAARSGENRIILMADKAQSTDDVVVVGYGRQKKITVTGAVSSITGKEIRDNPTASLQNTLAGRLPGFFSQQTSGRPGADGANFFIRGLSSPNGNNQPLIIVDDIEFTYDQFARIDPNEVETLTILKDASTTAVYGVRGANGVMVVTTRRGKIGAPQIAFRTEATLSQPTKIQNYLNSFDAATLYNTARVNDGNTPYFSADDLEKYRTGSSPYTHPDVNWKEVLFRKFSQQYRGNLDVSGGTEKVKYFISVGYLNQGGLLKNFSKGTDVNSNYYNQRYNYRSNLDIKVTKTTDMQLNVFGNIAEVNVPRANSPFSYNDVFYDYSSFLTLAPFAYPVYNPDGTYGYSNWQKNSPIGGTSYDVNNIVGRLTLSGYQARTYESNMNFNALATQKLDFITKGLSVKGVVAYTSNYSYTKSMSRNSGDDFPSWIYTPATATTPERYEPRNASVYRVRRLFFNSSGSQTSGSTVRRLTTQAFVNYDRTFQNRHHFYGLFLFSQNTVTQGNGDVVYNFVPNNFQGFTGRLGYDFKQKYLVELNGARNGSDRFSANNRYGVFPAGSVGWNISEEGFFKNNIGFINRMKLRGSYGLVGNDQLGNGFTYYYQQSYSFNSTTYFGLTGANNQSGLLEGRLANSGVTWEKEKKLDVGVDIGLFKNKLSITADYFNNNRYDILTVRGTVSSIFGQSLPPVNLGKVNNRGFEIELNYGNTVGKDFSYNVKGTYSYAKNRLVYVDEPDQLYPYQAFTGNSIGMQRVYTWVGFYKDSNDIKASPTTAVAVRPGDLKYADLNGDGKIDGFDTKVQGFPNVPNTTAGIQFNIRYKNFNIGAFFQGSMNFNVRAVSEAIRAFSANLQPVHQEYWTPERGDAAKYPRITFSPGISDPLSYPSTFWFIKGDYIRLKTAEIGYSLPKRWVSSLRMKDIRVYSNGYNIFTWTKLNRLYNFDPEIETNRDRVNYPPQRSFNFGLSATF